MNLNFKTKYALLTEKRTPYGANNLFRPNSSLKKSFLKVSLK